MNESLPITISDAHEHFIENFLASDIVEAINDLIKKYWNGTEAVLPTYEITNKVSTRDYSLAEGEFAHIEDDEWQRVKPLFESMGWNVTLYKDCHLGNYEHIPERFVFTKPTEGRERKSTMNTNKMLSMSAEKLMSRMFRKVDGVVWDLMTGKLGVVNGDGEIATIEGDGEDATISINPFQDFGIAIPAFAQSTPADAVKVGDLIFTSGARPKWIVEIKTPSTAKTAAAKASAKKTFRTIDSSGTLSSWNPPKVEVFGLDGGVMVVRSLMTMLPGGADGLAGFQGALMPMLMLGGGDLDLDKMLPLMLMGGLNGGSNAGGMGNMMQTMMMMKMMGGDGGGLFGGGGGSITSGKTGAFR